MKHLLTASLAFAAMLAFALSGSGCADSADDPQYSDVSETESEKPDENEHAAHAHPSEGPHGGDLIELGNENYHAELVHPEGHDDDSHPHGENGHDDDAEDGHKDDDDHEADHDHAGITVYILDSAAKNAVPIDAAEISLNLTHDGKPVQFKLAAMPEDGEPAGQSSRFASADKGLLEHFHENDHVEGTLVLKINGKSFRGKLSHKHDDDHGHGAEAHGSGHDHAGGDALVWRGEPREHEGLQILLGHHGEHLHAGEAVEPAVSITRDGKPVGDVKVFNSLLSADGKTVLAKEVATVFEPTTEDEPAHYAQGALTIPKGVEGVIIRYRIVMSDAVEVTFNVSVMFSDE